MREAHPVLVQTVWAPHTVQAVRAVVQAVRALGRALAWAVALALRARRVPLRALWAPAWAVALVRC